MGQEEKCYHSFNIGQGTETPRIIFLFVQKGDVLAPEVMPRILIAEDTSEASERKKGKQGHKTHCPDNVVLTNTVGVLVFATTQATGQQKYQLKVTTDILKSNGEKTPNNNKQTNKQTYLSASIPLYSSDY